MGCLHTDRLIGAGLSVVPGLDLGRWAVHEPCSCCTLVAAEPNLSLLSSGRADIRYRTHPRAGSANQPENATCAAV